MYISSPFLSYLNIKSVTLLWHVIGDADKPVLGVSLLEPVQYLLIRFERKARVTI